MPKITNDVPEVKEVAKEEKRIHLQKYVNISVRSKNEIAVVNAMVKAKEQHTEEEWKKIFEKHLTRRMG